MLNGGYRLKTPFLIKNNIIYDNLIWS